jgi:hypothetical protein
MIAPGDLKHGDPVEITAGMSKARRGIVQRPADWRFGDQPQWFVRLEGSQTDSVIRQDYLRRMDV